MIGRLFKLCVSFGMSIGDRVRAHTRRLLGRQPEAVCVMLYYHAVPAAHRRSFGRQMDALLRIGVPVRADAIGSPALGSRSVAVTFDDGFVSVVENALPELRSRRIPCTIFVPTGSLGTRPSWLQPGHPDAREIVAPPELIQAVARDDLVAIGSHSITHPNFRTLDDGRAHLELAQSKLDLETILKKEIRLFSFPHGACTQRSIDLARQAGYSRVFTIDPTVVRLSRNQFVCGRVRVEPGDWPVEFRLKAKGAYRWLSRASAWKRELQKSLRGGDRVLHLPEREA